MLLNLRITTGFSLFILILLLCFSSCLTPGKIDRWIDHEYGNTVQNRPRKSDYIHIIQPESNDNDTSAFLLAMGIWNCIHNE